MFSIGDKKILNLPEQVEENVKDIDALNTKVDTMVDACKTATSTSETASANATEAVATANDAKATADEAKTTADEAKASAENISTENDATFGANVEVDGKLTLNSTSDIVFKDGSTFETGGVDLSNYVDLDSSQIITGQKEFHRISDSSGSYVFINNEAESSIVGVIVSSRENPYDTSSFYGYQRAELDANGYRVFYKVGSTSYYAYYNYSGITATYSSFSFSIGGKTINMPTAAGTLALTTDIPSVPSYYRHNITAKLINEDDDTTALIHFSIINQSSTEIVTTTWTSALGTISTREATGIIYFNETNVHYMVTAVKTDSTSGFVVYYIDTSSLSASNIAEANITLLPSTSLPFTDSVETL